MSDGTLNVETPPVETPPVETPPVETPPVETPPVETPPVETPPVETPPVETPPVETKWSDGLPEDLKGNERLKGITTVEDLARKFTEAKLADTVPEPDGYTLPKGAPKDLGVFANKLGLTQDQLNGFVSFNQSLRRAEVTTIDAQHKAKMTEWGDNLKSNMKVAQEGVDYVAGRVEGLKELLGKTQYHKHPVIMETFKAVGEILQEGGFIKNNNNTPTNRKKTYAEAMFPNQGK